MPSQHQITLSGPIARKDRISGHLFRDLLDILIEGAERALRFRIEGRSTASGPYPHWLSASADFALLRVPELGASSARIEAAPLVETMAERFKQGERYADLDPRQSAIELFEDALEDAILGNTDSDRFDTGLVKTFEKFAGLFEQGLERIELVNGRTLRIDQPALEHVHQLARSAYAPQRVRVAGQLETIRYSDCRFTLLLDNGAILHGTAIDLGQEALQNFFGRHVILTGIAVFRPSGKPLRIEAERIEPASERDSKIWSTLPKPLLGPLKSRVTREELKPRGGLKALLGKWPGDESDEQVNRALENLS